jgi:hypothetical protein
MRSDKLSQYIFYAGWLGLPWLWTVHVLYWRGPKHGNPENEGIVNPDDRT